MSRIEFEIPRLHDGHTRSVDNVCSRDLAFRVTAPENKFIATRSRSLVSVPFRDEEPTKIEIVCS